MTAGDELWGLELLAGWNLHGAVEGAGGVGSFVCLSSVSWGARERRGKATMPLVAGGWTG